MRAWLALLLALSLAPAQAAQWWVAPGESIQAAIDRAAAGDVLRVARGRYRENLRIDKPLTLVGSNFTTLDGASVLYLDRGRLVADGSTGEVLSRYVRDTLDLHPAGDTGIDTLRGTAARFGMDMHSIPERGPFDLRAVRLMLDLFEKARVLLAILRTPLGVSMRPQVVAVTARVRCRPGDRVQFMVAHHGKCGARLNHAPHDGDGVQLARPTINEVTDEDRGA